MNKLRKLTHGGKPSKKLNKGPHPKPLSSEGVLWTGGEGLKKEDNNIIDLI
jgi:hypothetical protein